MTPSPRATRTASKSLRSSGDRWLFGYADIVTLLFACFAALYAAQEVPPPAVHAAPATTSPAPTLPPMRDLEADVASVIQDSSEVRIEVTAADSGLVVSLAEAGSFPPGKADLTPAAERVISQLADTFRARPVNLRVEGHTDDEPIHASKYESNWELSTARAARVVAFLAGACQMAPSRLSAAGFGEFRPKIPNDSPGARARNRRVDLVVLPSQAAAAGADYRDAGGRPSSGR